MGIYDDVIIDSGVDLPEYEGDSEAVDWQTKSIGRPHLRTLKLTAGGRLLRKEQSMRDLTPEERTAKALERGFDSWEAWEAADSPGPLPTWNRTVDEEWWVDHHQHGSFEFHGSTPEHRYSYEARFTDGALDGILLLANEPRQEPASGR